MPTVNNTPPSSFDRPPANHVNISVSRTYQDVARHATEVAGIAGAMVQTCREDPDLPGHVIRVYVIAAPGVTLTESRLEAVRRQFCRGPQEWPPYPTPMGFIVEVRPAPHAPESAEA